MTLHWAPLPVVYLLVQITHCVGHGVFVSLDGSAQCLKLVWKNSRTSSSSGVFSFSCLKAWRIDDVSTTHRGSHRHGWRDLACIVTIANSDDLATTNTPAPRAIETRVTQHKVCEWCVVVATASSPVRTFYVCDVSGPVESNVQVTQFPSVSVRELQRQRSQIAVFGSLRHQSLLRYRESFPSLCCPTSGSKLYHHRSADTLRGSPCVKCRWLESKMRAFVPSKVNVLHLVLKMLAWHHCQHVFTISWTRQSRPSPFASC